MNTTFREFPATQCGSPISVVCEEDLQEKQFDELIKLWVDGKITYEVLLENYPDYDASMAKKIFKSLSHLFG